MVVVGVLVATLALTIALYRAGEPYLFAALAFLCIAGTQVVFWSFTFPGNEATADWPQLPEAWRVLRAQWEYSHAAGAVLNAAALPLLVLGSTDKF